MVNNKTGFWHNLWRLILVLWGFVLLIVTAGFVIQEPLVTSLWPWPDGRLTYIFVGSIMAAVALPIIWIGASGELAAQAAGALDFALSFAGISIALGLLYVGGNESLLYPVFICIDALLLNLVIFLISSRMRFQDQRRTPILARLSFLLFALLLIGVGGALVIRMPYIFPWPLKPETSIVIGWIFLGAAVYFIHGFFKPYWANAKGQLLGFLAYDLILLWPYYQHLQTVKPEHELSLQIYLGVLVYSFLLAVYFLFLHPSTRFGSQVQIPTQAQPATG